MDINYDNVIDYLVHFIPEFSETVQLHESDYGQILPHVLFGDFTRFTIDNFRKWKKGSIESGETFKKCVHFIEELFNSSDPLVEELPVVSFLENLHWANDDYIGIKSYLGKMSQAYLRVIEEGDNNALQQSQ